MNCSGGSQFGKGEDSGGVSDQSTPKPPSYSKRSILYHLTWRFRKFLNNFKKKLNLFVTEKYLNITHFGERIESVGFRSEK